MTDDRSPAVTALVRHPDGRVEDARGRAARRDRPAVARSTAPSCGSRATSPDADTIEILRREFDLHPLVVEDVQKRGQRPKLDAYENQHVLVAYEA